ncbi:uncharacterized protein BDZ99DRAFT_469068 [Mytilinidion resinicola]|uniref:Uncharacterized protein n=1 Tax=Mytilinidion resinicola TaxID=574789 RepID=A0A6A6Y0H6_9PEZI|nr:uncharacterized protein BDZ99DRAFT_469068 [Mytilinidion resinicola]KAF2802311.1 hypothetical protein BDZ99DRAFT_469068 [Mytilinidion resinicola]
MQQRQKVKNVVFAIPKEPTVEQNCSVEDGVVKSASGRPQRLRNPPKRYDNSIITIE